jgi:hypothetical protein
MRLRTGISPIMRPVPLQKGQLMKFTGRAAALAVLAYVAAFMFFRLANPDFGPWGGDITNYFLPTMVFIRDSLLRGELPLWDPYQFAGTPFLALHTPAVLYPFLLVFALLPPSVALVGHVVSHFALAALFMWLLARRIGLEGAGCLTASLAFIGSFQMTMAANHNTAYLSTYAWLPASLWAIRRVVREPAFGNCLLFAIVLSLGFLGGFSQGFLFIVQVGCVYALYLLGTSSSWSMRGKALAFLSGSGIIALALVSVQLLPTLEHVAGATRNFGGLSLQQAAPYGLGRGKIWEALSGWGVGFLAPPALFVPLAVAAVAKRGLRREALFFVLLLVLTVDFMRGARGIVFPIYYQLPLGDLFRFPLRISFVTDFAIAMLLGIGVSAVVSRSNRHRRVFVFLSLLLPACIAADVFLRNPTNQRFDPLVNPKGFYRPARLVDFASTAGYDRMFLVGLGVPLKFGMTHRAFTVPDYEPMLPGLYGAFFAIPAERVWHGQLDLVPSEQRGRSNRWFVQDPELLDLMSVRYYVDARLPGVGQTQPLDVVVDGIKVLDGSPAVYEREAALPRVYVVHELIHARSEAEILARVREGAFDKKSAVVVLDSVAPLEPAIKGAVEFARIVDYQAHRVTIEASCASACLLVQTDLFDPNWHAVVDGAAAPVTRVNFLMRGVHLTPGRHRVEFAYEPASFKVGALISLASVVVIGGAMGIARMRAGTSGCPWRRA